MPNINIDFLVIKYKDLIIIKPLIYEHVSSPNKLDINNWINNNQVKDQIN